MTPVALVTGTSTGIGLATAVHFARRGDRVFAAVRDPATATALDEAIARERLPVTRVTIDVDDGASVTCGVGEVLAAAGRIDVLVNNAGFGGGGPIEDVPIEWTKALFETNYFGAIRMIQAVLPGMRARRAGAIVNVSSVFGRYVHPGHGYYAAAKHALEAASEALAQEVHALGIRVVVIEPGAVVTPIFQKAKRFVAPGSPYAYHLARLLALYQQVMKTATPPEAVAETIYEAVTTKTPRLRWVVGEDAQKLLEGRRRMTDEEFIAAAAPSSDDDWKRTMRARYGFDWP